MSPRLLGWIFGKSLRTPSDDVHEIRAQHRLDNRDAKLEPDYNCLTVARQVELICHLWQQYVSVALLPLASSSIVVRRDMALFNNQVIARVEGLTSGLLQKLADCQ